jgi:cysteinyl-tRNA synthetase
MSAAYLGDVFDIHGGGLDLIFPHHENEIAQSRCAHGTSVMANYWMHNGFLEVEGKKMSKSEGNFVTINELLETKKFGDLKWNGNVLRFAMLMSNYRQPIDWTVKGLELAFHTLEDFFRVAQMKADIPPPEVIVDALSDDLNTAKVIAELHALRKKVRGVENDPAAIQLGAALSFLGFNATTFFAWLTEMNEAVLADAGRIDDLVEQRQAARARKDFKESDRIRDELAAMGVVIKDSKEGTTWEIAR